MKKRLLSLLLTVVMLVSLCSAITVSASADAQVTTVTMSKGDTVLGLCQKMGIDYYANKNLIMKLNGFTSENQFSKIGVGTQIILPVSNTAGATLAGGNTATVGGTITAGTSSTVLTTGTGAALPAGDYVSYYIVPYTIQSGETIAGLYNSMGLSYKTYSNQILKLNNIANYNSIPAGKTLLLPVTSAAIPGVSYTTVMAHVMKAGENSSSVCGQYGLNPGAAQTVLQALNNRTDLSRFNAGEVMYVPVTGIVSAQTNVSSANGAVTTTGTVSTDPNYNITAQNATNGSFYLDVDGKSVTTATAGKVVKVVTVPDAGFTVDTIKVVNVANAAQTVQVNNNSFVMPNYAVTVSVTFKTAKSQSISIDDKIENGTVAAVVGTMRVDKAYVGSTVSVKTTPKAGFMLQNVRVTYNEGKDTVAVRDCKFVMPDEAVTVTAKFVPDPNYKEGDGYKIDFEATNGTITARVGTKVVTSANAGDKVFLSVAPDAKYTVESLLVYTDNFSKNVKVDDKDKFFIMPEAPVTVVATIKATGDAAFPITKIDNAEGAFKLTVDGKEVTSAKVGQTVKIEGTSNKAFFYFLSTVTKTGDNSVSLLNASTDTSFIMPDYPVTVGVKFYILHNVNVDTSSYNYGNVSCTYVIGGGVASKVGAGAEVRVNVGNIPNGKVLGDIVLTYQSFGKTSVHTLPAGTNTFVMPDCDVLVRVNYADAVKIVAHDAANVDSDRHGNSYSILGNVRNDDSWKPANRYTDYTGKLIDNRGLSADGYEINSGIGNTVVITPNPILGYSVSSVQYGIGTYERNYKTGKVVKDEKVADYTNVVPSPITGQYQFTVPNIVTFSRSGDIDTIKRIHVNVTFEPISTNAIKLVYAPENADHSRGTVYAWTSIGVTESTVAGTKIFVKAFAQPGYAPDYSKLTLTDKDGKDIKGDPDVNFNGNDQSFYMPDKEVYLSVPFKATEHTITLLRTPLDSGSSSYKGVLSVTIDGQEYTDEMLTIANGVRIRFPKDTLVTVNHSSNSGYILGNPPITVSSTAGLVKYDTIDNDSFSFLMPDDDVTIGANYKDDMYAVKATAATNGEYTVAPYGTWSAPLQLTSVSPAAGYEFEKLVISYTDCNGDKRTQEFEGTTIPALAGMPKSEVEVNVFFKPKTVDIKVNYTFSDDPVATYTYQVDAKVNGVATAIESDATNGNVIKGTKVGDSVILTVSEANLDKNFVIDSVWLGSADNKTVIAQGELGYAFTVPSSAANDGLTVNVSFKNVNKVNLDAVSTGTAGATATFTVNGKDVTSALPGDSCTVSFDKQVDTLKLAYTDKSGIDQIADVTVATPTDTSANTSATFEVPQAQAGSTVTLKYVYNAPTYEVTVTGDSDKVTDCVITNEAGNVITEAAEGSLVYITVTTAPGYTAKITPAPATDANVATTYPEMSTVADGKYVFRMGKEALAYSVTAEPSKYNVTCDNPDVVFWTDYTGITVDDVVKFNCNKPGYRIKSATVNYYHEASVPVAYPAIYDEEIGGWVFSINKEILPFGEEIKLEVETEKIDYTFKVTVKDTKGNVVNGGAVVKFNDTKAPVTSFTIDDLKKDNVITPRSFRVSPASGSFVQDSVVVKIGNFDSTLHVDYSDDVYSFEISQMKLPSDGSIYVTAVLQDAPAT